MTQAHLVRGRPLAALPRPHGLLLAAIIVVATGCTTVAPLGPPVEEVDAAAVQGCTAVGELNARSLRDSGSPAADLQRVREQLLAEARALGATHLVLAERDLRYALATARGTAYRCG